MMFKCYECGHLFEDGEQAIWYENQGECHGRIAMEKFGGCPMCKGDYEEAHQCKECDEWHTEDELYDGWCEKCLRETINYDTFFEYCEANNDEHYLDVFVLSEFLGGMDLPKDVTTEFHCLMVEYYKREVKLDRDMESIIGRKTSLNFLDRCIRFIMDDDGSIGRENYADWLNKREVK
jgi:hypothetical protein